MSIQEKLAELEQHYKRESGVDLASGSFQSTLFAGAPPEEQAVIARLKALDPDNTSPREALDALYDLTRLLGRRGSRRAGKKGGKK